MHYLFFSPHRNGEKWDLERLGYGDFADGAEHVETAHSPNGQPGFLYGWRSHDDPKECRQLAYLPQVQEWVESARGDYWVGFWKAYPPRPDDLEKTETPGVMPIRLNDGCEWKIRPIIDVSQAIQFIDNDIGYRIHDVYQDLYSEGERIGQLLLDARSDPDSAALKLHDCRADMAFYALGLLRRHYRILPEVVNYLGQFDDSVVVSLVGASLARHPMLDDQEPDS